MADDREVLREVWLGRLPAIFTLASDDLTTTVDVPDTFCLMLPRLSYLALATDKVRKFFAKFAVSPDEGEIWFDFQGNPVKMHLPIGVIYDQLTLTSATDNSEDIGPPLKLTVHFTNFPDKDILKCNNKELAESHFMSNIKEADQIKHGGRVVSSMQKKDHNQLWQGLLNDKFDQFWAINRRLMEVLPTTSSTSDESSKLKSFKSVPVRFYEGEKLLRQKLVKPVKENGDWTTAGDLIADYFCESDVTKIQLLTQGIVPDLETPLQWMAEHLSYPDNFLHIVSFCCTA